MVLRRGITSKNILEVETYNATTSDVNFGALTSTFNSNTPKTIVALVRPIGSGEGGFGYILAKTPSASTAGMRFYITHNAGAPHISYGVTSSTSAGNPSANTSADTVVYGTWQHIAITHDGGLTQAGIAVYSGSNGLPLSLMATTGADGTGTVSTNAADSLHIGNRQNTDRTFNGDIAYVAMWNRILGVPELLRAQRDGPGTIPGAILLWANKKDFGSLHLQPSSQSAFTTTPGPAFYSTLGVGRFAPIPFGFAAVGASFSPGWARAANTVITTGARAA